MQAVRFMLTQDYDASSCHYKQAAERFLKNSQNGYFLEKVYPWRQ